MTVTVETNKKRDNFSSKLLKYADLVWSLVLLSFIFDAYIIMFVDIPGALESVLDTTILNPQSICLVSIVILAAILFVEHPIQAYIKLKKAILTRVGGKSSAIVSTIFIITGLAPTLEQFLSFLKIPGLGIIIAALIVVLLVAGYFKLKKPSKNIDLTQELRTRLEQEVVSLLIFVLVAARASALFSSLALASQSISLLLWALSWLISILVIFHLKIDEDMFNVFSKNHGQKISIITERLG